tara:strand:- start:18748 stop:19323 length:576 start_codon:yes stop_codon:yes gene_type:complete
MLDAILSHVSQYVTISEEDKALFTAKLTEVNVSKRNFLLRPGTTVKHEYFVIKGCLKAYYIDTKGNSHIIQFAIENWWVGDFDAFYNKVPSKLYIEAVEDTSLLAISFDDLSLLFQQAPIFERYFRILVTNAFIAQRKRIMSTLEKRAEERYLEFCAAYSKIETRITNYDVANYLGLSPESLSRIRTKIKS